MPGDGLARGPPAAKKAGGSYHRFSRIIRHSLRDGFNGFLRALPGVHDLLVTVASRDHHLAGLAPAQGCQDHTPSPSASVSLVRAKNLRADTNAAIASRLTSGDDWPKRPSSSEAGRRGQEHIFLKNAIEIFHERE